MPDAKQALGYEEGDGPRLAPAGVDLFAPEFALPRVMFAGGGNPYLTDDAWAVAQRWAQAFPGSELALPMPPEGAELTHALALCLWRDGETFAVTLWGEPVNAGDKPTVKTFFYGLDAETAVHRFQTTAFILATAATPETHLYYMPAEGSA